MAINMITVKYLCLLW